MQYLLPGRARASLWSLEAGPGPGVDTGPPSLGAGQAQSAPVLLRPLSLSPHCTQHCDTPSDYDAMLAMEDCDLVT